jgi:uncharacterized protein (TIGR03437 family)
MLRGLLLLFLASAAFGGTTVPLLLALPTATNVNAIQVDPSGNILVAGVYYPNVPASPFGHAFVGKLTPDGSQVIWWTPLAGSQNDGVLAMALGSDNSVYVTGTTQSPDFPTTSGSMQPATSLLSQAFAAKLSPTGAVVYATYIGGSAETTGTAIAVGSSGNAFITGAITAAGVFPTSPGAVAGSNAFNGTAYILELNAAGSAAPVAISGFGGAAIAIDPQGNIYAAGAFQGPAPTTPAAFQTGTSQYLCSSGFFGIGACPYQHVAKIDPTGTKLIFATYIAGAYGAIPSAIAVDAAGNVIVAGSTNSPDYPTTPTAYQPEYFANPATIFAPPFTTEPPLAAGFVTKLSGDGSSLVWSTLVSGSGAGPAFTLGDGISAIGFDSSGNILLAGRAASIDFPGLWLTPVASRPPQPSAEGDVSVGFVARLSPDGTTLSPTELIPGSVNATAIAGRSDGSAVIAGYGTESLSGVVAPVFAVVSLSPVGRVAAISDTADNAKIVSVAPGQLLTLYGTDLAPTDAYPSAVFPTSFNGVTVRFNGIAAPILYTSAIQINLQVPYEISGQTQVTMQVASQQVSPMVAESYILAVVERQPSVFIVATAFSQTLFDMAACNGQNASGLQPLALNADGTANSCANPAASGSVVTIFLNGLGVSNPAQTTGVISPSPVAINPAAAINANLGVPSGAAASLLSTTTLPGSIDSLAQVQIQVSSTSSFVNVPLEVQQASESPFLVRGPGILIWVRPAN